MFFPSLLLSVSFFERPANSPIVVTGSDAIQSYSFVLVDVHHFFEVSIVECFELLLVLNGLLLVSVNDVAEVLSSLVEHLHRPVEVILEGVGSAVLLHLIEAGEFELSALQLELDFLLLSQQTHHLEVDLGSLQEVDRPVHVALEGLHGGGVVSALLDLLDLDEVGVDESEVAIGGLNSSHLSAELVVVGEEELDIDGLGVGLVAEDADEDLEHTDEAGGGVVFESKVHELDGLLGHLRQVGGASVLESLGLSAGALLALNLTLLGNDFGLDGINGSSLRIGLNTVFLDLGQVVGKLLALDVDVALDLGKSLLGSVPVIGLELAGVVEGGLTLATLLVNELLESLRAKSVESSLNICKQQTTK